MRNSLRSLRRFDWPSVVLASGLIALTVLSPRFLPFNVDEFCHFQPLGCHHYPLSGLLHVYLEGCHCYDLRLPFTQTYLPLRSYSYIGSISVIPYYPFWYAIRDPISARIQGVVFFLVATLLLARLTGARFRHALLAGLVYPVYFFSFMADTGPVGLMLIATMATLLLIASILERSVRDPKLPLLGTLAGLMAFVALFVKLVFLWLAVPIGLFLLFYRGAAEARRKWRPMATGLAVFIALSAMLLFSKDRQGVTYLREGGSHFDLSIASIAAVATRMQSYFTTASLCFTRHRHIASRIYDIVPLLLTLGVLSWAMTRKRERGGMILALAMAAIAFAAMCTSPETYYPHHIALSMFFLVWGVTLAFKGLGRRARVGVLAGILIYWGTIAIRIPGAGTNPMADFDKDRLLSEIREERLDAATIQVHIGWGTYYIANLFGDSHEAVLYLDCENDGVPVRSRLDEVKEIAQKNGRGVLFVTDRPEALLSSGRVAEIMGKPLRNLRIGHWGAYEYLK